MRNTEFQEVAKKLQGAADLFNRSRLSEDALLLWWEAVKGFDVEKVVNYLTVWVRSESRMPLPKDFIESNVKWWE